MPNSNLILRTLTSPYNDTTLGGVLNHADLDNNFIYLKGLSLKNISYDKTTLSLSLINGDMISVSMSGFTSISGCTLENGNNVIANGLCSHAEGHSTEANGDGSHAEGSSTYANGGSSHTEGYLTISYGDLSHSEGYNNQTFGEASHAEGKDNLAIGNYSHSEGNNTQSIGEASHAEGKDTLAYGDYSHVEGNGVISENSYQSASGKFNETGNTASIFVVGCGVDNDNRGNAFSIDLIDTGLATIVLPKVASSFNYNDDTEAAAGGIPIGGVYHTSGVLKIRLS